MDDLLREFVGETLEMMEAVAGDLVAWEADPSERSGIDRIFRTIHTVKGSSGFFDLPRIAAVSHAAEELLDALRERRRVPDRALVATVLAAFERIRGLTQAIAGGAGEPVGDDSALIAALMADVRGAARDVVAVAEATGVLAPDNWDNHSDVPQAWRSVRLPVGLLDELMNGVSDLVLARNEVAAQVRARGMDPTAWPAFERLSALLGTVRASVGQMRMVPLRTVFTPLPRLVRQLAAELGKDVRLDVGGGEVEIDREVGEALRDPMVHVLRNAIDHGFESAEVRLAAGKPAVGTLRVSARQANNRIVIAFEDDGAGISIERITARAVANGVISGGEAASLSPAKAAELIFSPGLSTAAAVTGISGRGVGMDVVKANVERLGGFVHVHNRPGQGLTIEFDVPMTLTIISALAIDAGGQSFAVPRSVVEEVLLASSDSVQRQSAGGAGLVRVRGRLLPLLCLEDVLGLAHVTDVSDDDRAIMLCRIAGNRTVALDVPDVRDHEELVIKPLPPLLLGLGLYSGMSLPDNGRPMLLIDIDGIAQRQILPDVSDDGASAVAAPERVAIGDMWLLFQPYGSERTAAVPMALVDRLVDVAATDIMESGGRLIARLGEALVPVATIGDAVAFEGTVRLIRLSDGRRTIAIPVDNIGLMTGLTMDMAGDGSGTILGLARFADAVVEMIDGYGLIAQHSVSAQTKPLWLVDAEDGGWTHSFLRPSLMAIGYDPKIVRSRADVSGDAPVLEIGAGDGGGTSLTIGGTVIDAYDREEIVAALDDMPKPAGARRAGTRAKGKAA